MPSRGCLLLGLLLIFSCLLSVSVAEASSSLPQDLWYSIYFQGQHSGYSHISSFPDRFNGVTATCDESTTVTKITVFGTVVEQDVESKSWSDVKTGEPFYQTFKIESGGTETDVDAKFTPTVVVAILKSGSDSTIKQVPIPPGEKIINGDTEGMDSPGPLTLGQTQTDLEFDPLTLTLDTQISTVIALHIPVKDAADGTLRNTAEIAVHDSEGSATAFQDGAGTPIRIMMPAGISMVRCSKDQATDTGSELAEYAVNPLTSAATQEAATYSPSPDLAVSTSVNNVGQPMGDERTLSGLTVKITVPGQPVKTVTESAVAVPPTSTDPISSLTNDQTNAYLTDAPYLSLTDPAIKSTSQQIVGAQTDSYSAVKLIHDWVYNHMTPKGSLGVPRSASDVIANPVGVCRDYAVLYTSLARAAGIPTKVNAGLVGFKGKFYYHAWASSYVGGTVGWLPVDATMPSMFVDASHIPLGSGDPTVMFALADVIGNMHVEALKAEN